MAIDRGGRRSEGYLPLRDAMQRLFEGSVITPGFFAGQGGFPPVDAYLTEDDFVVELAVPGANPDDINISVTGDTVTLTGEVKHTHRDQRGQLFLDEIPRGRFQRSFSLPIQTDPDKAEASFNNGILVLRLPKSEATKPRKIQVKQGQQTIQGQSAEAGQSK
ncbi:MAG: Hsp20/alpha crystallin family protein [Chloroflexi bacterium]|nr:Hsp20/alpha crystallin family protein [Chloroflexota bacterium]